MGESKPPDAKDQGRLGRHLTGRAAVHARHALAGAAPAAEQLSHLPIWMPQYSAANPLPLVASPRTPCRPDSTRSELAGVGSGAANDVAGRSSARVCREADIQL